MGPKMLRNTALKLCEIDFPLQNCADSFDCDAFVENSYVKAGCLSSESMLT